MVLYFDVLRSAGNVYGANLYFSNPSDMVNKERLVQVLSCGVVSCLALSQSRLELSCPCRVVSYRALSCRVVSCPVDSCLDFVGVYVCELGPRNWYVLCDGNGDQRSRKP